MITVMIVDDHPMVRDGMTVMLEARRLFKVVCKAPNGASAVEWIKANGCPDVILSDVRMPLMDGFQTVQKIHRFYPDAKVLLLAGMPLREEQERAKEIGAAGYLSKSSDVDSLAIAIQGIARGAGFQEEAYTPTKTVLSPRELDVIRLIAKGQQREEVAEALDISPETVKSRLKTIMQKLNTPNAAGAVSRAYELGILRA